VFAFLGLFNKYNYCRSTPLWHTRKQPAGKNTLAYFVKPSASNVNDFSFLLTARQNKIECLNIKHSSLFCPAISN
jgi:hypothetical protein